jgi:hypothetical protein
VASATPLLNLELKASASLLISLARGSVPEVTVGAILNLIAMTINSH